MSDNFLGEIRPVAFNFAPRGWALCDGQLLPISQNTGLFSLLGTTYGGDGKSNFALPDLRGRVPIHTDHSNQGEVGGEESISLPLAALPGHTHAVQVSLENASTLHSSNNYPGKSSRSVYGKGSDFNLSLDSVTPAGSGLPHENRQPLLTVTFIIAMSGIFPPRG